MRSFQGTMVALVTPFNGGELDVPAFERLVDFQLREGTDGVVVCGTTGESPTLTEAEHDRIVDTAVRRVAGRCPVIVGTGSNCTATTVRRSQQARDAGADGVMVVTPYYNKPTQAGLYHHFAAVARAVELPIVLYNIPGRCGREIAEPTICSLYRDFENITTVKHATGGVQDAASLHAVCPITILSGDDPLTLPLMSVGARGVISVIANLVPRRVKAMSDALLGGDYAAAQAVHEELFPLSSALLSLESNPIPIKTAMAIRGMVAEEFRLPMCPMQPDTRARLVEILGEYAL